MSDFMQGSCREFVDMLASKNPVPGGGGASAFVCALGVALGNMVGSLTIGKKKYASVQEDILSLQGKATMLQQELLALVAEDADAFAPLAKAYGLPSKTEEEQKTKVAIMEKALQDACAVPVKIMQKCCEAIDLLQSFADKGSKIAISDAGCGVICCKAALKAASLNVFINTKLMKNEDYAKQINIQTDHLLDVYTAKADAVYAQVLTQLRF